MVHQRWNREAAAIDSRSFYFHYRAVWFLLHNLSEKFHRMDVDLVDHVFVRDSVDFRVVYLLQTMRG